MTKLHDAFGLMLVITPAGGRYWHMRFRNEGKEQVLSFGAYPMADAFCRNALTFARLPQTDISHQRRF